MNQPLKRAVGAVVLAAAVVAMATGCTPTKAERLDGAQMELDCDRLGGVFREHPETNGVYDPICTFDDITNLRLEEER
jgi:hypothetical protein